jgi:hypothetical protein
MYEQMFEVAVTVAVVIAIAFILYRVTEVVFGLVYDAIQYKLIERRREKDLDYRSRVRMFERDGDAHVVGPVNRSWPVVVSVPTFDLDRDSVFRRLIRLDPGASLVIRGPYEVLEYQEIPTTGKESSEGGQPDPGEESDPRTHDLVGDEEDVIEEEAFHKMGPSRMRDEPIHMSRAHVATEKRHGSSTSKTFGGEGLDQ